MNTKSGINWTDKTWSPVTGCSKVSEGCKHCYAEREVETRWSKNPKSVFFGREFTDVQTHASKLNEPLHWKKPLRIFVCPRADLFHESVPDEFINKVFAVMALARQHTFQVLTKRPERMLEYLHDLHPGSKRVLAIRQATSQFMSIAGNPSWPIKFPLPNVWLGVTAENQKAADERIPLLLQTPASVRWVSMEPLLGAVDISRYMPLNKYYMTVCEHCGWIGSSHLCGGGEDDVVCPACDRSICGNDASGLDWVVVGGESGPSARQMYPDWARSLRAQCADASVPFLFKQWGEWAPYRAKAGGDEGGDLRRGHVRYLQGDGREPDGHFRKGDAAVARVGKKTAGRLLEGVLHDSYPEAKK